MERGPTIESCRLSDRGKEIDNSSLNFDERNPDFGSTLPFSGLIDDNSAMSSPIKIPTLRH